MNISSKRLFMALAAASIVGAFAFQFVGLKLLTSISSRYESNSATIQAKPVRGSDLAARVLLVEFIGHRLLTSGTTINKQEPVFRGDTATMLASNDYRDCIVTVHKDQNPGNDLGWLVGRVECESK